MGRSMIGADPDVLDLLAGRLSLQAKSCTGVRSAVGTAVTALRTA